MTVETIYRVGDRIFTRLDEAEAFARDGAKRQEIEQSIYHATSLGSREAAEVFDWLVAHKELVKGLFE